MSGVLAWLRRPVRIQGQGVCVSGKTKFYKEWSRSESNKPAVYEGRGANSA